MNITWQGTDITGYVLFRKAVARDTCGGRCDGLEMTFENAESWYRWQPEEDDEIRVARDGWDSGKMYLNTIAPQDGKYRVLATTLPVKARKKEWRSFENKRISEILQHCAAMTGMEYRAYGIDESIKIPYIQQENESCAAFLHRLAILEGSVLKCVNGRYTLIGLEWAQSRNPVANISIRADQDGVDYRRSGSRESGITLTTPYATGTATDSAADQQKARMETGKYPAVNSVQAARWARNLLKNINRKSETLILHSTFNPSMTAMCRVNVTGGTDADGEWLIEEAEHDLQDGRSTVTLHRCITTVE